MPNGTFELASNTDFPAATALVGNERIPALRGDGTPIAITPSLLISPATNSGLVFASWSGLQPIVGTVRGQKAEVLNDGGTHVDPITGATQPNNGTYSWNVNPAGWQWLYTNTTGQLATEATARQTADQAETQARSAADATEAQARSAADTAETQARQAADQTEAQARLQGLSAEAQTRAIASQQTNSAIAQEAQTRQASDATEAQARVDGDKTNSDALAAEAQARVQSDNTEAQARSDGDKATLAAVAAEAKARSDANAAEVAARTQAIATEAKARQDGDAAQAQARVDGDNAEATARQQGDKANSDAIATYALSVAAEATARQQGDRTNSDAIAAEATARQQGDKANNDAIVSEANTRDFAIRSLQGAIGNEASAREQHEDATASAISSEASLRAQGDAALDREVSNEIKARASADTLLGQNISDLQSEQTAYETNTTATITAALKVATDTIASLRNQLLSVAFSTIPKPGDTPAMFTSSLVGSALTAPAADPAAVVQLGQGNGYSVAAGQLLATRGAHWLEPGAFYAFRTVFERTVDPVDISGGVFVGVQWLDQNYVNVGQSLIKNLPKLSVTGGRQIVSSRLPTVVNSNNEVAPPAGAVYFRPFVSVFGADGFVVVESMSVVDVTNTSVYAPDVEDIRQKLTVLQSNVLSGNPPDSILELPSYTVQDLPVSPKRVRKAWASDACAPDLQGNLEPTGKGSGAEVVYNPKLQHWVLTGSNQAVQA